MYDENIEKTVLFYLIFENEEGMLKKEDFLLIRNQQIYSAIVELKKKKEEINIISVKDQIKGNDTEILKYISDLVDFKFGCSFDYAYKKLKELSKKRELVRINKKIQEDIDNNEIEEIEIYIEKQINSLKQINEEGKKEETFQEAVEETSDIITKKYLEKENYENKYTTGIFDLDRVTNGLHQEELTIIGARPRCWKNSVCIKNSR